MNEVYCILELTEFYDMDVVSVAYTSLREAYNDVEKFKKIRPNSKFTVKTLTVI